MPGHMQLKMPFIFFLWDNFWVGFLPQSQYIYELSIWIDIYNRKVRNLGIEQQIFLTDKEYTLDGIKCIWHLSWVPLHVIAQLFLQLWEVSLPTLVLLMKEQLGFRETVGFVLDFNLRRDTICIKWPSSLIPKFLCSY